MEDNAKTYAVTINFNGGGLRYEYGPATVIIPWAARYGNMVEEKNGQLDVIALGSRVGSIEIDGHIIDTGSF